MRTRSTRDGVVALDQQQTVLLDALRRAAGAPVSYAQLQEAGIEFPASVVSELELMGVVVERRHANARGERQLVGVRLEPSDDPRHAPVPSTEGALRPSSPLAAPAERARAYIDRLRPGERIARSADVALHAIDGVRALGAGSVKRWLAPAALLCAAGAVSALVLAQSPRGGQAHHLAAHDRPLRPVTSARPQHDAPTAPSRSPSTAPGLPQPVSPPPSTLPAPPSTPPTPVSAALAAQLDAEGHSLLEAGRYGSAIALLQRTLAATGESLQDCLQPVSETCLTYAYALYDLGSALLLDGHPAAAVPVLQRRVQIDNQRATVQAQLRLALTQSG